MATTTLRPLKFFNGHVLDTAVTPKRPPRFYFILLLYYFPGQKNPLLEMKYLFVQLSVCVE